MYISLLREARRRATQRKLYATSILKKQLVEWIFLRTLRKHLISLKYDPQTQDNIKTVELKNQTFVILTTEHSLPRIKLDTINAPKISLSV